jgi:hypothetical protein
MTADGSQSSVLVEGGDDSREHPTWLPDGSRVAFQLNGNLYTIKTDGTGLTYVRSLDMPQNFREYSYLTDRIILYGLWGEVEVMDLVTGSTQSLGLRTTLPAHEDVTTPAATPDLDPGSPGYQGWIAYANKKDQAFQGEHPPISRDIHIVRLTGSTVGVGESTDLAIDPSTIARLEVPDVQKWPEWSADGGTIAYHQAPSYANEAKWLAVVSVNLDLNDPNFGFGTPANIYKAVNPDGTVYLRPAVSPDGRWIAFKHRIFGNKKPRLELIRYDGEHWKDLTPKGSSPGMPHWNPVWQNDLD